MIVTIIMEIQNGVFPIIVLIFVVVISVEAQPISSSSLESMGFLQRDALTDANMQRNRNQLISFGDNLKKNDAINGGKRRRGMAVSDLFTMKYILSKRASIIPTITIHRNRPKPTRQKSTANGPPPMFCSRTKLSKTIRNMMTTMRLQI